jgi:urea transport system substrate-binding protein
MKAAGVLSFARFRIDVANQQVWRDGELVEVRPKAFQVLLYLVLNPQRLITREELLNRVWSNARVSSSLLRSYVWELRQMLGDTAEAPRYLETVNRRGYRFLEAVRSDSGATFSADDAYAQSLDTHLASRGDDANGRSDKDFRAHHREANLRAAPDGALGRDNEVPSHRHQGAISPRASNALTVGVLHSLTGTMAFSESPVVDATLLAIDEINRRGGLLGRSVTPLVVDGKSDGATFASGAHWLLAEKQVSVIFGCWMSAHRKRVLPIIEGHDNLLLYPVQYEGLESSPNVFYTGSAPNQQIIPAVRWTFGFLNCRRPFLVGSDYIFPRVANEIIRDQITRVGGQVAGELYIPSGSVEVTGLIAAIVAAQPDLIINTINGDSNIAFFRSLRRAITPERIPTLSFSIGENELRNLDIPGDYAAWNYFQSIERPENRRFVQSFRNRYGPQRVTSDPMEAAYLGVNMWAQAVAEAGSHQPAAVREALRHQSYNGPEGVVWIEPINQHTWKTIRVGRITNDSQFEIMYSSEKPIRPEPYPDTRSSREWDSFVDSITHS